MWKRVLWISLSLILLLEGPALAYTEKELLQLAKLALENQFYDLSLEYLSRFKNQYPKSDLAPYGLVLEGITLRRLGKLSEAKETFTAVIFGFPESEYTGQAYYLRGETNLALSLFSQAEEDFKTSLDRKIPEEMGVAAYRGILSSQASRGKIFEALTTLREMEGRYPQLTTERETQKILIAAAEQSITTALRERDFAKVYTVTDLIQKEFPEISGLEKLLYYRATALYQEGKLHQAQSELQRLKKSSDPEIAGLASFRLGEVFFSLKDYAGAEAHFLEAKEKSPDLEVKAASAFQLGVIARKKQDYSRSEAYLQEAWQTSQEEAVKEKSLWELATTSFLSGNYQKALSLYQTFRNSFPGSEFKEAAFLQEAFALYNLKRYRQAKDVFEKFLALYPESNFAGQASYGLGLTFMVLGEKKRGAEVWEGFLSKEAKISSQAPMVLLLARYFIEENKPKEAETYLQRLVAVQDIEADMRAEAFLLLGLAFLKETRIKESITAFDAGLQLPITRKDLKESLMKNKADLLMVKGDYEKALPLYQELLNNGLLEKRGEILYGAGVCLHQLGKTQEAVPFYLEAMLHLPADSPLIKKIKEALNQIKKR